MPRRIPAICAGIRPPGPDFQRRAKKKSRTRQSPSARDRAAKDRLDPASNDFMAPVPSSIRPPWTIAACAFAGASTWIMNLVGGAAPPLGARLARGVSHRKSRATRRLLRLDGDHPRARRAPLPTAAEPGVAAGPLGVDRPSNNTPERSSASCSSSLAARSSVRALPRARAPRLRPRPLRRAVGRDDRPPRSADRSRGARSRCWPEVSSFPGSSATIASSRSRSSATHAVRARARARVDGRPRRGRAGPSRPHRRGAVLDQRNCDARGRPAPDTRGISRVGWAALVVALIASDRGARPRCRSWVGG